MIIAISGKLYSGKNTLAYIFQMMFHNQAMKDKPWYNLPDPDRAMVGALSEPSTLKQLQQHSEWELKAFAYKVKVVASLLTGIPVECFEDQEFKKQLLPAPWKITGRELLQLIGTDAMRNVIGSDVWVNALFADYTPQSKWIITDPRFPNELEAVEKYGGFIVRIERDIDRSGPEHRHPSETSLDYYPFKHVIFNNGSLYDLVEQAHKIFEEVTNG